MTEVGFTIYTLADGLPTKDDQGHYWYTDLDYTGKLLLNAERYMADLQNIYHNHTIKPVTEDHFEIEIYAPTGELVAILTEGL